MVFKYDKYTLLRVLFIYYDSALHTIVTMACVINDLNVKVEFHSLVVICIMTA